jgi:hypothetical protein
MSRFFNSAFCIDSLRAAAPIPSPLLDFAAGRCRHSPVPLTIDGTRFHSRRRGAAASVYHNLTLAHHLNRFLPPATRLPLNGRVRDYDHDDEQDSRVAANAPECLAMSRFVSLSVNSYQVHAKIKH